MNDNTRIEVLLLTEASDGEIAEMLREVTPPPALAAAARGGEVRSELSGGLALAHETRLEAALDRIESDRPDAVLLDLHHYEQQGLDPLTTLLARRRAPPVVVLTGLENRELGIEASRPTPSRWWPPTAPSSTSRRRCGASWGTNPRN
ncbi:hypothetical protein BRD14_04505 [Halobacteriales archaeon SW_5_68_122]|nr:MAG: hypothetical protein BRD14_04505 [Halobacteriales archaeon SW_5_68_122]